ncbi:metal-dependent transcriptional regulator [Negadavirga shengliensis]|uniref:Transcriptional regulator MntR n=1 Tax=Negadavirga shengliensis TaxID=1389218 RepID=A0ABV9T082_9BACT
MKPLTNAEENYLKAIYHLSEGGKKNVSTNEIAHEMKTKPASVSDMLKKLSEKGTIGYKKYYGVDITPSGIRMALHIIRRHRLWEVFLVDKLGFSWDEVHEVAEELEHVKSPLLVSRLDDYLGFPKFDPHGDPIPDEFGDIKTRPKAALSEVPLHHPGKIVAVNDSSAAFLKYLDKVGVYIGAKIEALEKVEFDGSLEVMVDNHKKLFLSREVAINIMVLLHP